MKILLHSTKPNLVWANICLTHTEWRERERERGKSFVIGPQTWLTERQWQHLSSANCWAGHSSREGRMGEARWWEAGRVWENASHNCITTILVSFIPFTGNTSYNSIEDLVEGFSPVLLFYHFPTSASSLITKYTNRLQWSNHTRS